MEALMSILDLCSRFAHPHWLVCSSLSLPHLQDPLLILILVFNRHKLLLCDVSLVSEQVIDANSLFLPIEIVPLNLLL